MQLLLPGQMPQTHSALLSDHQYSSSLGASSSDVGKSGGGRLGESIGAGVGCTKLDAAIGAGTGAGSKKNAAMTIVKFEQKWLRVILCVVSKRLSGNRPKPET